LFSHHKKNQDQGSSAKEEITIARDGARSTADIERMVKEAEAMAEQDKAAREKIEVTILRFFCFACADPCLKSGQKRTGELCLPSEEHFER